MQVRTFRQAEDAGSRALPHQVQIQDSELKWESLHEGGFFILDTGLEIFIFQGALCNPWEKFIGASMAKAMRDEPHRTGSTLYVLDTHDLLNREEDYDVEAFGLLLGRFGRPVAGPPSAALELEPEEEGEEPRMMARKPSSRPDKKARM